MLTTQGEGVAHKEHSHGNRTGEGAVESEGTEAYGEGNVREDGPRYMGVDEVEAGEAVHSLG